MKAASSPSRAILASGQWYKAELYQFDVLGGSTYRYTNSQAPITVGGFTYGTGLTIMRGPITQKAGLEVQSFDVSMTPQLDSPSAPILIESVPFLSAVRRGILDGAIVTMSKIFLASWSDTSPGLVVWAKGQVNHAAAGRFTAQITVNDSTENLNVSMPPNIIQPGCLHTLFDAGCTLLQATFTVSGAVTGTPGALSFTTNLTQADKYFDLGKIKFTSGANSGKEFVVRSYLHTGGGVTLLQPPGVVPSAGDTFTAVPGCDKSQATCTTKFSNLAHFRGEPYVPVPETLYDGNTQTGQSPTFGAQGGSGAGSTFSGGTSGTYQP